MAYNDYTGSTQASVALLTNIKGMLAELYNTYVAEIEEARGGEPTLLDQIDSIQSLISGITTEITNARDGESVLLDKINAIDTAIAALAAGSGVVISSEDATVGFVEDKILAGTNITITKGSAGGGETVTISGDLGKAHAIALYF